MDDLDVPHPVLGGQGRGLAGERGGVGSGPEHYVAGAAGRIERLCLPGAGEGRAQQDPRFREFGGGWHDLIVEDHDRRHPECQPHCTPAAGATAPLLVSDQVEYAARLQVRPGCQLLADHDRVRVGRVEDAAGLNLDPVDRSAFAAGGARLGHHAGEGRGARAGQRHLQECR